MNTDRVEKLADALLYEGYMLYPYRPSSIKNQRRFNFGVLVPPAYSDACAGTEASIMRTECLLSGSLYTKLNVKIRFLHLMDPDGQSWQPALPREIEWIGLALGDLISSPRSKGFCSPPVSGSIEVSAERLENDVFRVAVGIANVSPARDASLGTRDGILPQSMISTHTLLTAAGGGFVSLLDPPEELREAAAASRNIGTWPVLVGDEGERSMMLSSPIILYDYPQLASESPGDLFDATEIDEILTLRILTLTDAEKQEMRESDDRSRRILERTESMPAEHFTRLHGALRGVGTGRAR